MAKTAALKRVVGSPVVNFLGVVFSVVVEIYSWTSAVEPQYVQPAAFLLTVFFLGRMAYTQFREAQALRDEKKPKFEIVFAPKAEYPDSRPFLQVMTFGKYNGPGAPMSEMRDRRYRVGVVNLSSAIIPSLRVVLASCSPGGNFVHVGHRLLVMDSNPPAGERDLPPSSTEEPTLWFDVVNECDSASRVAEYFFFCFANPEVSGPVTYDLTRGDDYSFDVVLRAEGAGYSCQRSFRISKEWDDGGRLPLKMEPL